MKIAVFVSKVQSKNQTSQSSLFFPILQNFDRTFTVFGEKHFGRDIKIENCSLRLKRSIKKPNFWKFWCFFKLFRFLNEHSPCLAQKFSAGISKLKIAVFVSENQSKNTKNQTSESSDVFSNCSGFWTNIHRAWRKSFQQGYQIWKLQCSSQKFNQKTKLLKVLFFSNSSKLWTNIYRVWRKTFRQGYQNWKLQSSSQKINQKPNFWNFSFFSNSSKTWTNIYRLLRKTFRQGYQNWKLQSSSHKIKQKIKLLKILFFFKVFRTLNEHLPCLAKKIRAGVSNLKIVLYVFRVSIWEKKNFFESFVSFRLFRTWNMKFLDLWRQKFHPGCQSCILLGYMNSLWDVGIRSDITWRQTLFEPWQKSFDLFDKTALYVSKGTLLSKKTFSESSGFFQTLQVFERTFTVLGKKNLGRDIKDENCSLRLKRSIKKPNFWNFSFFSNSSELWTNIYRAWRKIFKQGYQIWKLQSSSQKFNQKIKLLKVLFLFQFFKTLIEHLPCLAKNISAGISKLKIAVFVSKDQSKNQTSESSDVFSNSSGFWTNIHRAWRKSFQQGYQNWKLQSSSQKINQKTQKTKLLKVLMFFQTVQVFERTFTVLGEKVFSRDIKFESCSVRLKSSIKKPNFSKFSFFPILPNFERTFTVFGEKLFGRDIKIENCSLRLKRSIKNQTSEISLFFPILQKLERTFTVFCEKLFGRDIKIENCSLRLIRSNKKSNFWKFSFFSKSSELWTNIYRAWRKRFGQGYQTWKLYSMSSEYQFEKKKIFWKFCKFSFVSDLEHEVFGFVATEISPGLSKLYSTWLYEFSLRCWY